MTTDDRSTPPPASPSVSPSGAPTRRTRRIGAYVAAWAALALLAAFYLTALALRLDIVSEQWPIFRPGEPEGNQGQRAMSKALAEVQGIRQSVSQMQLELAKLKTDLGATQDQDKAISSRIALLEEKVAAAQPALASAAGKTAPIAEPKLAATAPTEKAAVRDDAARLDTGHLETGSIGPPKTPAATPSVPGMAAALAGSEAVSVVRPKVINAPPPAIAPATAPAAQVAAAATAIRPAALVDAADSDTAALTRFGPATVSPAKAEPVSGPIGIRISNGPSLDALRLSWSLLSDRHPGQLGSMEARYAARVPQGDADPTFDLIAGPVKSQAEAKRICKALAAKNIPCQIGSFGGPTL